MSLRARIEAAAKREPVKVRVSEWDADVYVRHLSVSELQAMFARREKVDESLQHAVTVAFCVTEDAAGVVHLWDADCDDDLRTIDSLGGPVLVLVSRCHEVNGLSSNEDEVGNSQDRTDG